MNRMGQIACIILMLALSCLVIGWANSYPVSLRAAGESNLIHISWLFWLGLFGAYPALFFVGINSKQGVRVCCLVLFLLLFSAHNLLYLQAGSGTEAFIGSLDRLNDTGLLSSATAADYHWPVITVWGFLLQHIFGTSSAEAYVLFWGILIIGCGVSSFLIFYKEDSELPFDFLGCTLYLMALFWFWKWQISAYNWSLILVFAILSIYRYEGWKYRLFVWTAFLMLTLSNGILSLWMLGIIPVVAGLEWIATRKRPNWSTLIMSFAAIQICVLLFDSLRFARHIVFTASTFLVSIMEQEIAVSSFAQFINTTVDAPTNLFDIITKWIAWSDLGLLFILLAIGLLTPLWRKEFDTRDWGLVSIGATHFALENVIPLFGMRALNIIFVLPSRGITYAMEVQRMRTPVLLIFLMALVLFPVNQLRTQSTNLHYNTAESLSAARFLSALVEQNYLAEPANLDGFGDRRIPQTSVLADQTQLTYMTNVLPAQSIVSLNPWLLIPENIKEAEFTVVNSQVKSALSTGFWPDPEIFLQELETTEFDRIYDSGTNIIFQRSRKSGHIDTVASSSTSGTDTQ